MLLNRRALLEGALALGGVVALPRLGLAEDPAADAARGAPRRTLVLLHLNGGNDGLNTVIPYADPLYRRYRPSLAVDRGQVRRLDERLGLHPALAGLEALWRRERLAIVNGVGYPEPDYSHFRATEIWYTAEPERSPTHGWIGRALAHAPRAVPLRAVALEKQQPLSLLGPGPGAVALTDFSRFRAPAGTEAAQALYARYGAQEGPAGEVGRAGAEALAVAERIARLAPVGNGMANRGLSGDLRKVLALLGAGLDLECICLSQGGYDTHSNQAPSHQRLLGELGGALDAYQRELERLGLAERSVLVVFSEFGRRVPENLSGGTDHGSAGPVFLVGTGLVPGWHGAYPSLEDLDRDNFRHTTDFRSLYAALLARGLGQDPRPVLGDFKPLEVFA